MGCDGLYVIGPGNGITGRGGLVGVGVAYSLLREVASSSTDVNAATCALLETLSKNHQGKKAKVKFLIQPS